MHYYLVIFLIKNREIPLSIHEKLIQKEMSINCKKKPLKKLFVSETLRNNINPIWKYKCENDLSGHCLLLSPKHIFFRNGLWSFTILFPFFSLFIYLFFFIFLHANLIPPSLLSSCLPYLHPTPHPICSSESVRPSLGSQLNLFHHFFEAGPRISLPCLGWAKYIYKENGLHKIRSCIRVRSWSHCR